MEMVRIVAGVGGMVAVSAILLIAGLASGQPFVLIA
jgi:hypothetical protein